MTSLGVVRILVETFVIIIINLFSSVILKDTLKAENSAVSS